jgi:hypothetical protein
MVTAISAAFAATVCALAAWAWPHGVPAWGALIMPAAAVVLSGAPRLGHVSRHDLARILIDAAERPDYLRQAIVVGS